MSPSISTRLLLTQSDVRLVGLARDGHERAFEALVRRYRRPLLSYCRRLLLPDERAEDALQQGLLQVWLALQGGVEVSAVRPWLYRVVHNAALNMLRVSGYDYATLNETLQGADAPQADLDRRIAVREALAGLAALPPMQREALLRTAVDGHTHEQAAAALGLSEDALRGLVYRARATLRAATTALTPTPIVSWAIGHRGAFSTPLSSRVAELGTTGGSLGIGGALLKGGTAVVTAGVIVGSAGLPHHRHLHAAAPSARPPSVEIPGRSAERDTSRREVAAGPSHRNGLPQPTSRPAQPVAVGLRHHASIAGPPNTTGRRTDGADGEGTSERAITPTGAHHESDCCKDGKDSPGEELREPTSGNEALVEGTNGGKDGAESGEGSSDSKGSTESSSDGTDGLSGGGSGLLDGGG